MEYTLNLKINNVSQNACEFDYWIVKAVNGGLWYYGATNRKEVAENTAREVDGFVVRQI